MNCVAVVDNRAGPAWKDPLEEGPVHRWASEGYSPVVGILPVVDIVAWGVRVVAWGVRVVAWGVHVVAWGVRVVAWGVQTALEVQHVTWEVVAWAVAWGVRAWQVQVVAWGVWASWDWVEHQVE